MKLNHTWKLSIILAATGLVISYLRQRKQIKDGSKSKLDQKELEKSILIGATIGGLTGLLSDHLSESDLGDMDHNEVCAYLQNLKVENPFEEDDALLKEKAEDIKTLLFQEFNDKLEFSPADHGSHLHDTALQGISDRDILMCFKHESSPDLLAPVEWVEEFLNEVLADDDSLNKIRRQKHSIGLIFNINGQERNIDVVVSRRTRNKQKKEYNIYRRPINWGEKESRVKFNPSIQADLGIYSSQKAQAIYYLKYLAKSQGLPLKSSYIKELCKKAIDETAPKIPKRLDKLILHVMAYTRDNLPYLRIKSSDNTNNILSDSLSNYQKEQTIKKLEKWILQIEKQPAYFTKLFPNINDFN
ncbi:MAG: hypothetical protein MRZ79_17625 [Bacteroidia bacterium]|nr:hypothetical protein [Bacteroidia bacterium]